MVLAPNFEPSTLKPMASKMPLMMKLSTPIGSGIPQAMFSTDEIPLTPPPTIFAGSINADHAKV